MNKIGLLFLFVAGIVLLAQPQSFVAAHQSPSERIAKLWRKDLAALKKSKIFPKEEDLKKINFIPANALARTWLFKASPEISAKGEKKGKFFLEVTLMAWAQKDHGLVVQYELFEGKKRHKAWEFARTYTF